MRTWFFCGSFMLQVIQVLEDVFALHRPRSATRRMAFHQSKCALRGLRPKQLALRSPDKTCSELARGKDIFLVREVLFAALKFLECFALYDFMDQGSESVLVCLDIRHNRFDLGAV